MTSAARVAERAAAAQDLPDTAQLNAFRELLRADVHDAVMQLTADSEQIRADELAELAAAVRAHVPEHIEGGLNPRLRVFVRLLRVGALEPAWTLAHDNASGVVRPSRATSMWAGGSFLNSRLPLPTRVVDGRVYAWLPGFRDPRWNVPDEVYDIDADVVLRNQLEVVTVSGTSLRLVGSGYLGLLETSPDDRVSVELLGPAGARESIPAQRVRRSDDVRLSGPELTRLAWSGWTATIDLAPVLAVPGSWRVNLEVVQQGAQRIAPLGRRRAPIASDEALDVPHLLRGRELRVVSDGSARLSLRVSKVRNPLRFRP